MKKMEKMIILFLRENRRLSYRELFRNTQDFWRLCRRICLVLIAT